MCRMKKSIYFLISTLCVCFVFSFVSYFSTESYAEEYIDALSRICFRIPDDWEKEKESDFTQFGTYQAAFKPVNSNDLEFFISVDDMWAEVKEAQETGVGREYFNMEIFSVDDIVRMALNQKAIEPSSANLEKIGDKEYYVLDFDDEIEIQWADEPGYEDEDDDNNIAGLNEGTITLNEEGLRRFISYSVAKLLKEGNLGTTVHFGKKESEKAADRHTNPYKGMTWDEYCEAKRKERGEDKERKKKESYKDKKKNLGTTIHF